MRRARSRPRYLFFLKLAFGWVAPEERKSEPLPARAGCAAEYSFQQLELKKGPLGKHNILVERVPIFAGLHFRRREPQWRFPSRCSHVIFSPGWVQTDMGGANAALTPEQSIRGMRKVLEGHPMELTGKFLGYDGATWPW